MLPTIKVCGITREEDIFDCLDAGVNWLGINLYSPSPRSVSLARAQELCSMIPDGRSVLVDVVPDIQKLHAYLDAGFDQFQLHFSMDLPNQTLSSWSELVGRKNLWLAPKLPPGEPFPEQLLGHAETIVVDSYSKHTFGGTGKTGNWVLFKGLKMLYPQIKWVLAGGLNPQNLRRAVQSTGTEIVDLNSGIETAPGIKDSVYLDMAIQALNPSNRE
ncbi:MAG: phosphoribosylanthranilate isomerase [Opitutae bacterium]|jgi:phosphoribosylanthranilate isomerase|nr:phosphoribosylanthranilate isomerase [Opitutae bacterium]MBT5690573.1 phosphoribosylanthranilate isomerase [Opitutae bacterium]MBT6463962.1 phosphoribosylanthranilate isomerase [Opitutae bacterium]MBT6958763.1 phosphoribosylanthranilate isomerase [Opitutae bacterium]